MTELLRRLHQQPIVYFPAYKVLTGSTNAAVLLSYLMYHFAETDEALAIPNNVLMKQTMLTENELRQAKKQLNKSVEFLSLTRQGMPARTVYVVDWKKYEREMNKVYSLLDSTGENHSENVGAQMRGIHATRCVDSTQQHNIKNYKIKLHSFASSRRTKTQKNATVKQLYVNLALKLKNAVAKMGKLKSNANLTSWATEMERLRKRDGIAIRRIKAVLSWYCSLLEEGELDKYIPQAFSGKAFRDKFERIEAAKERLRGKEETSQPTAATSEEKRSAKSFKSQLGPAGFEWEDCYPLLRKIFDYRSRTMKKLKEALPPDVAKMYSKVLLAREELTEGYASYLSVELPRIPEFSGDLARLGPGSPMFARFMRNQISAKNLAPDNSTSKTLQGLK